MIRHCEYCGGRIDEFKGHGSKYCKDLCRRRAKYRRLYKKQKYCVVCKIPITNTKYCSKRCQKLLYRLLRLRRAYNKMNIKIKNLRYERASFKRNRYNIKDSNNIRLHGVSPLQI